MVDIVRFPIEPATSFEPFHDGSGDRFLLDEGLEVLADFRSIDDQAVRASIRALVKTMAIALRKPSEPVPA